MTRCEGIKAVSFGSVIVWVLVRVVLSPGLFKSLVNRRASVSLQQVKDGISKTSNHRPGLRNLQDHKLTPRKLAVMNPGVGL